MFLSYVLRKRIELRQKPLWKTVNFQQEWAGCIMASLLQDGVPSQPHCLCPESCEIHSGCLATLAKYCPEKEFWRTAPATKGGVKHIQALPLRDVFEQCGRKQVVLWTDISAVTPFHPPPNQNKKFKDKWTDGLIQVDACVSKKDLLLIKMFTYILQLQYELIF